MVGSLSGNKMDLQSESVESVLIRVNYEHCFTISLASNP
jgi:hypothetical protein